MAVSSADLDFDSAPVIMFWGRSGQGKSAAFDAMVLCWTGKKRSNSYVEYIKQGKQSALVEMEAEVRGTPIFFKVELHHKNHTPFSRSITYEEKTYVNNEAAELVESLDVEYYFNVLAMMQGPDSDIVSLTPARRSEYMQRLFNFSLDDKIAKMKAELESMLGDKASFASKKETNESLVAAANGRLERLRPEMSARDVTRTELRIAELEKIIDSTKAEKQKKDDAVSEALELSRQEVALKTRRNELHREQVETERKLSEENKKEEDKTKAEKKLSDLEKNKASLESEHDELDAEKTKLYSERTELTAAQARLKERRVELRRWSTAIEEEICPHCGQPSAQHAREMMLNEFGCDCAVDIDNFHQKEARDLEHSSTEVGSKIKTNESALADVRARTLMNAREIDEAKKKASAVLDERTLDDLKKKSKNINDEVAWLEVDIDKMCERVAAKNAEVEAIILPDVAEEKNEVKRLRDNLVANNAIVEGNEKTRKDEAAAIEAWLVENAELVKKIDKTTTDAAVREEAIAVVSKHFMNWLVVKTCDDLQQTMNDVIHSVFPSYHVRLEQSSYGVKFSYTKDDSLDKKAFNRWIDGRMSSGFERALLSVSFRISLCLLYGLPICFLDEVDQNADEESSKILYDHIFSLSDFDQVFVISHKPEIRFLLSDCRDDSKIYLVEGGKYVEEE